MAKYMIHTCKTRDWYVEKYLIPSMLKQGIKRSDIIVYLDINEKGCLEACVKSFALTAEFNCEGVWHLQDDVLISSYFKEQTENNDSGIVCGFASKYDKEAKPGKQRGIDNIWYSFPCIRIPNMIAEHFSVWFNSYLQDDKRFEMWIRKKKNDDLLFRYFLDNYYKNIEALNLAPNLVEHVDWLIGGSIINAHRGEIIRSIYWEEEKLVEDLKNCLTIE